MRERSDHYELRPLRLSPRGKRTGCALVLACFLQATVGCMPVYRPPRRTDFFRAKPSSREMATAAATQEFVPLQVAAPPPANFHDLTGAGGPATGEYPLSLDDAIRIGLGNSGVVRVLSGGGVNAAEATAYDAEIAEARARIPLAAFDPSFTSGVYANWINQPPEAVFGPGLAEPTRRDEAGYTAALTKPWITGGETRVGYNPPLGYLWLPFGTSGFNPLYESNVEFTVRQPLLRNAGVAVNKAPIRVAQLRRDETVLETKQAAMASVRSITEAYWDLYATGQALRAIEVVVPLLQRVVTIEQERMNAQRSVRADVAKVQSQLRAVTQQAVAARSEMVQAELRLRNLLGLQPVDGYQLTPTSRPLEAPVGIDVESSAATALERRPEVVRRRLAVRTREQELLAARNLGRPQLDASALYRWNGVGERLDDSLEQMITTQFADWQTTLTFSMPLGRRAAAGAIRAATVQLAREKAMLQQATHSAVHTINALAREAEYNYQLFSEANARLAANADWLDGARIRYENPPPSGDDWLLAATNDYLSALRSQADAASDMQKYLSRYNSALARLNEAMGTILDDCNVIWSGEGGVPAIGGAPVDPAPHAMPSPAAGDYRMQIPQGGRWGASNSGPMHTPTLPSGELPPGTALPSPSGVSQPGPVLPRNKTPAETYFGPATSALPPGISPDTRAPSPMRGPSAVPAMPNPSVSPLPTEPIRPMGSAPAPVASPSTSWGAFGAPGPRSQGMPPAGLSAPASPPSRSPAERFFGNSDSTSPGGPPAAVEALPRPAPASPLVPPRSATPSAAPLPNSVPGRTPAETFFGPASSGRRFGAPTSAPFSSGPVASGPAPSALTSQSPPPARMSSSRRTPAETFFAPSAPASPLAPPAFPPAASAAPLQGPAFPAARY